MDKTDEAIITLLRANGRLSLSELARQVGISRTTAQDRISRLETRGVIAGYTVRLGDDIMARQVRAHVMLKVAPRAQDGVVASCRKQKSVRNLFTISGEFDLSALVVADTTAELDEALDALGRLSGVERTQTNIILSTKIDRGRS